LCRNDWSPSQDDRITSKDGFGDLAASNFDLEKDLPVFDSKRLSLKQQREWLCKGRLFCSLLHQEALHAPTTSRCCFNRKEKESWPLEPRRRASHEGLDRGKSSPTGRVERQDTTHEQRQKSEAN
jgi:hypothetical protein